MIAHNPSLQEERRRERTTTNLRPNRTIVKALSQKTKGGRKRMRRRGGREGGREED